VFAVLLACAGVGDAQTIVLKTGQRVETLGVRRSTDKVMGKIQVGESSGEVGHAIASIAKIEFPEPQGLKNASELLSQGQADRALAEITPVLAFYDQFRDIRGAWWGPAAVVKVSALAALGREAEAEALAVQIQKTAPDPETARAVSLRIASALVKKEQYDKALQMVDTAIKESTKPELLADAWVTKGNVLLAQKRWDEALLAFLRVPVFYRNEKLFMPPALLGSARAYRRLDDAERAKKSLKDLIAAFPKSAEAAAAQTELQKL
jgi:tetratricopeptide (TPR) repeat protein